MKNVKKAKSSPFETEKWYDLEYDKDLISQSVAKQYGKLPSEQDEMHYSEWILLVGGLMEDTPLGQTVLIRKENDKERLKCFTRHEHRIRNEWRGFLAKQRLSRNEKPEDFAKMFENIFKNIF